MAGKILVAGIGNILRGDDGIGPQVIRELSKQGLEGDVDIIDFGISTYDLLLAMENYDLVIIIDAVDMGMDIGEVCVLEIGTDQSMESNIDPHTLDVRSICSILEKLGKKPRRVILIGCQPSQTNYGIGLSPEVENSIPRIIELIKRLVGEAR